MDISLAALFGRVLACAAKASNLPTIQDETQELIQSALSDLHLLVSRIRSLSLFSPNEQLGDIATKDLIYLFVPFVLAEVQNRTRTVDIQERMESIRRIQSYLQSYLSALETYEIVPESEKTLYERQTSSVTDPAKRRELKIKQYQKEKELRTKIETVRKRRHEQASGTESTSDFDLIASLLPSLSIPQPPNNEDEDSETEDILREASLLLLRLTYAQAQGQVDSIQQEIELLRNAPPPPPPQAPTTDPRQGKARESDNMWRLDAPIPTGGPDGKGPLLDSSGKPLRPFTILPAGSTDRAHLQAQVFQSDHRLPTMSIDEYLEIERQRGNIISGGGPQSESKLTTSEQLALDSEMDGTIFSEAKDEEKRQKDEGWARYTDTHPKGAGNTMNRG